MQIAIISIALIALVYGWIRLIGWVDRDIVIRQLSSREFWVTLTFLTGPIGFGIYLWQRNRQPEGCPNCGKPLPKIKSSLCPYCKYKLTDSNDKNPFMLALSNFNEADVRITDKEDARYQHIPDSPEKWSAIRAVKFIIASAMEKGATDIHLEPDQKTIRIRFRLDGVLQEQLTPPDDMQESIIPCVKAMSDLDVAEHRRPLDGRMQVFYKGHKTDIRVSTTPTIHGEKIALRILDRTSALLNIDNLGMNEANLKQFRRVISYPQGMILSTGPTGSGKTTTLYAALSLIDAKKCNITTIEDPVEYQLDNINQIPINTKADVTFASGLRSILRQDPDVIMVGEIRDLETAEIAIRSALTGHLIFSTLHTNDAVRAVTRLMEIGMEPYLISAAVLAVLAQRLVRMNCPHCRVQEFPDESLLKELGIPLSDKGLFYKGEGCKRCDFTGFIGRTGVFELLLIDDTIRKLIDERASSVAIKEYAVRNGMTTMMEDALNKARKGEVSLAEISSTIQV